MRIKSKNAIALLFSGAVIVSSAFWFQKEIKKVEKEYDASFKRISEISEIVTDSAMTYYGDKKIYEYCGEVLDDNQNSLLWVIEKVNDDKIYTLIDEKTGEVYYKGDDSLIRLLEQNEQQEMSKRVATYIMKVVERAENKKFKRLSADILQYPDRG